MRVPGVALLVVALCACGEGEDLAYLGVKISATGEGTARRFPPGTPEPLFVNLRVYRSDDLLGAAVMNLDAAWADLVPDEETGKRTMKAAVPANADKPFDYLLRVSSVVDDGSGGLVIDECGVGGFLEVAAGEQRQVKVSTHAGSCSPLLCQSRANCLGQRYCLAFECYDRQECGLCPAGAGCDAESLCSGDCIDDSQCTSGFRCCRGICSPHCPDW